MIVTLDGVRVTAEFPATKMELILLLNEELRADIQADEPHAIRGWRSPEDLIPLLRNPLQQGETLRRTIWAINRILREAAQKVLPKDQIPRLIETKRLIGVRLHWPLHLDHPDGHSAR